MKVVKLGGVIHRVEWAHISPDQLKGTMIVSDAKGHQFALDVDVVDPQQWRQYIDA